MKRHSGWHRALASLVVAGVACLSSGDEAGEDTRNLRGLLERLDAVARTFAATALRFECKETIRWDAEPFERGGKLTFAYIYVREGTRSEDYRSWTGLSGKVSPKEVDPAEQGVPRFLRSAFHWIQIFRGNRWTRHRYFWAGRTNALGRQAVGVRFEPVPPITEGINDWYGTAWVDPDTGQILVVEAYRPRQWAIEQKRQEAMAKSAQLPRGFTATLTIERVVTEFGVEREGIRFPSKVTIREVEHRISAGRSGAQDHDRVLLEVEQTYRAYRFFATEATPVESEMPPIAR